MDRKRVLVTGAAGNIGLETVGELIKAPAVFRVRTLDLPGKANRRALKRWESRIEPFWGSVEDPESAAAAVRDVDIVIHLAAIIPPLADERPDLAARVNIWGTRSIISAMKQRAPDAFLLYTSSVSVYGDRVLNPWIRTTDPLVPSEGDLYAGTKITSEGLVRNSGLRYAIFRLSGVLSPERCIRGRMDPLMFHMPLNTSIEPVTTRDCGFALARSAYHTGLLSGRTFNLGGGEAFRIKYRDLLGRSFRVMGMDFSRLDENAFATRNFHCGFFADSNELEELLHFQRDSVESYLDWIARSLPLPRKMLITLSRNRAVRFMQRRSDPLKAMKTGNDMMIRRYFGGPTGAVP